MKRLGGKWRVGNDECLHLSPQVKVKNGELWSGWKMEYEVKSAKRFTIYINTLLILSEGRYQ